MDPQASGISPAKEPVTLFGLDSAKFFKRPTRKEKQITSLTKSTESSLFDSATATAEAPTAKGNKKQKDALSATASPTIAKKSSGAHPPKASLAYKMQLNGGIKEAVKNLGDLESEDEDMEDDNEGSSATATPSKSRQTKSGDLDKSKPRPDYVELMYGRQNQGNKRKTFMPKPAMIK
ncbi:hypothetical protein BGW38_010207 [Lunasporangiospora selenospora]|uniref:Uncharacterized protein n=1 Tax=Lunasporangiospora selenospora TaxID=979761 RepID=A0A9P6KFL7_9FUNG|nr:hypothetical protein BGW38_010207 [Lunasporangiospora selenospora]